MGNKERGGTTRTALKPGKRYWFYINNYDDRVKNGLFTGEYNAQGLALLQTKTGDTWCITPAHLFDAPEKVKRD